MAYIDHECTLNSLKHELRAWKNHIEKLGLDDRIGFVAWLSEALDSQELALAVDAEIERRSLWNTYLCERYGPCAGRRQ